MNVHKSFIVHMLFTSGTLLSMYVAVYLVVAGWEPDCFQRTDLNEGLLLLALFASAYVQMSSLGRTCHEYCLPFTSANRAECALL